MSRPLLIQSLHPLIKNIVLHPLIKAIVLHPLIKGMGLHPLIKDIVLRPLIKDMVLHPLMKDIVLHPLIKDIVLHPLITAIMLHLLITVTILHPLIKGITLRQPLMPRPLVKAWRLVLRTWILINQYQKTGHGRMKMKMINWIRHINQQEDQFLSTRWQHYTSCRT